MSKNKFYKSVQDVDVYIKNKDIESITALTHAGVRRYFLWRITELADSSWLDSFVGKYSDIYMKPHVLGSDWHQMMSYLEKMADVYSEKPNPELKKSLENMIDSLIKWRRLDEAREDNRNAWTDSTIIKLMAALPVGISCKYLGFLPLAGKNEPGRLFSGEIKKSLFEKYLSSNNKKAFSQLLEILLEPKESTAEIRENIRKHELHAATPIVDSYWFARIFIENRVRIFNSYPAVVADKAFEQIQKLFDLEDEIVRHRVFWSASTQLFKEDPDLISGDDDYMSIITSLAIESFKRIPEPSQKKYQDLNKRLIEEADQIRSSGFFKGVEQLDQDHINIAWEAEPELICKTLSDLELGSEIKLDQVAEMLASQVKSDIDKYFGVPGKVDCFLNADIAYIRGLVAGARKQARVLNETHWDVLLQFIVALNKRLRSISDPERGYKFKRWTVKEIAELVIEATRNDDSGFPLTKANRWGELLIELTDNVPFEGSFEDEQIITDVLNAPKGQLYEAMITLSLYKARKTERVSEPKWLESISQYFKAKVNNVETRDTAFDVALGKFLAQLYYLDSNWLFESFDRIFPIEALPNWKAVIGSHFFYTNKVHLEFYERLKKSHLVKAVRTGFTDNRDDKQRSDLHHVEEKMIQYITIGYLARWEDYGDDSLIAKLLYDSFKPPKPKYERLLELTEFVYQQFGGEPEKQATIEQIEPLWRDLFEQLHKRTRSEKAKHILSLLGLWIVFIDPEKLNKEYTKWLRWSAKHIWTGYNAPEFVRNLSMISEKIIGKNLNSIGKIYLETLSDGHGLDFELDKIRTLVSNLYEKKQKNVADRIANKHGEMGQYFLRDVYFKYNN